MGNAVSLGMPSGAQCRTYGHLLEGGGAWADRHTRGSGSRQQPIGCGHGPRGRSQLRFPDDRKALQVAPLAVYHDMIRSVSERDHVVLVGCLHSHLDHPPPILLSLVPGLDVPGVDGGSVQASGKGTLNELGRDLAVRGDYPLQVLAVSRAAPPGACAAGCTGLHQQPAGARAAATASIQLGGVQNPCCSVRAREEP